MGWFGPSEGICSCCPPPPEGCYLTTTGATSYSSGASTFDMALPALTATATLVAIICQHDVLETISAPSGSGWTLISSTGADAMGSGPVIVVYVKECVGDEGSTNTLTNIHETPIAAIVYCVSCPVAGSGSEAFGSSSSPACSEPSPTISSGVFQLAITTWRIDEATLSAFFTGYTGGYLTVASGSGSGDVVIAAGWKAESATAAVSGATLSATTDWAVIVEAFE